MEPLFSEYYAVNSANYNNIWLLVLLAVVGFFGAGLIFWRPQQLKLDANRRFLLVMLLFFGGLISLCSAAFSWLTMKPIKLYGDKIELPKGTIGFSEILKAQMDDVADVGLLNVNTQGKSIQVLSIKGKRRSYQISEEAYEVEQIFQDLKRAIDRWKKKNSANQATPDS